MYTKLKKLTIAIGIVILIVISGCVEKPQQNESVNKSTSAFTLINKSTSAFTLTSCSGNHSLEGDPAQTYASEMNISIDEFDESEHIFHIRIAAGKLQAELIEKETETFAGMWVEYTPKFKFVILFTRDSNETIRPYLLKYPELTSVIEVRTANMSLVELEKLQENISYSIDALNISINSGINIYENCVEIYVKENDYNLLKDALQKMKLPDKVKDKVKVILHKSLAEPVANNNVEEQQNKFVNTLSSDLFFPTQKRSTKQKESFKMTALISGKLKLVDRCLRVEGHLIVWPYGFSARNESRKIQIIDDNDNVVARAGDEVDIGGGGGEMSNERISFFSSHLPSNLCSGPYWIVADVKVIKTRNESKQENQ